MDVVHCTTWSWLLGFASTRLFSKLGSSGSGEGAVNGKEFVRNVLLKYQYHTYKLQGNLLYLG